MGLTTRITETRPSGRTRLLWAIQMNRSTGTIRARAVIPDAPTDTFSPACLPESVLLIGEPRETVLIDDLAVSADQGKRKHYVLIVGKENPGGVSSTVELGQMVDGLRVTRGDREKNHPPGAGASGMTVAPRLVPMRQNMPREQTATLTEADGDSASKAVRQ